MAHFSSLFLRVLRNKASALPFYELAFYRRRLYGSRWCTLRIAVPHTVFIPGFCSFFRVSHFSLWTLHGRCCCEVLGSFLARPSALSQRLWQRGAVIVVNSGSTKDPLIQRCLRQLWFISALHDSELHARHIPGDHNLFADALKDSRTFYRARDQLFLSTATQRLHLFWCSLILYFHSFLSFRVSCPCSFFRCLYAASSPSRLCWIYSSEY